MIPVGLEQRPMKFAEEFARALWGSDWLAELASRTKYSPEFLRRYLSQRKIYTLAIAFLGLESRRLDARIAELDEEASTIHRMSAGGAPCLARLYGECSTLRSRKQQIDHLHLSARRRAKAYDAWFARGGDPDEDGRAS